MFVENCRSYFMRICYSNSVGQKNRYYKISHPINTKREKIKTVVEKGEGIYGTNGANTVGSPTLG